MQDNMLDYRISADTFLDALKLSLDCVKGRCVKSYSLERKPGSLQHFRVTVVELVDVRAERKRYSERERWQYELARLREERQKVNARALTIDVRIAELLIALRETVE